MARIGGYKIIDLKDVSLTSTAVTIDGIHKEIQNAYRKATLLHGIVLDAVKYADAFVPFAKGDAEAYTGTVYGKTITIASNDEVTIA